MWDHRYHRVAWGPHGERSRTKTADVVVKLNRRAEKAGVREQVFTASSSDVFDNQVPDEWRSELFDLIRQCSSLDWLVLTKRPQNILKMLPPDWGDSWPHVWLGTSTENQEEADRRIPHLQAVPARVRFLSAEPLLEAISPDLTGIDWVIVGGESGMHARPMDPSWARQLRDQCAVSDVSFFMKQMSAVKGRMPPIPDDMMVREFP